MIGDTVLIVDYDPVKNRERRTVVTYSVQTPELESHDLVTHIKEAFP